jgi:hypothetical protein
MGLSQGFRDGQANFSTVRKSANSWTYSALTNSRISWVCQSAINPQMPNPQISTRYTTTLSQNSPKSSQQFFCQVSI